MRDLMIAFGIGAVCGARSMLGPALVANVAAPLGAPAGNPTGGPFNPPGAGWLTLALAAGEMLADKAASIPARTTPLPLVGRVATGALSAAAWAPPGDRRRWAAAGMLGALTGTVALFHVRRLARQRLHVPNVALGLAEDALAVTAGLLLLQRR